MKNVWKIFRLDCSRLKTNVVAVIILIGLTVVPALYAWFNILSNWDPYQPEATSQILVAVASKDEGYTLKDVEVQMGETVMDSLKSNTTIGWVFTETPEEAIDGVYTGEYYAALVFPEDFSKDMMSFLTEDFVHPELLYYVNEKKNAIAVKITDKAQTAVVRQINATLLSTIAETTVESVGLALDSDLAKTLGVSEDTTFLEVAIQKMEELDEKLEGFSSLLEGLTSMIDTTQDAMSLAGSKSSLDDKIAKSQNSIAILQGLLNGSAKDFLTSADAIHSGLTDLSEVLGAVGSAYRSMGGSTKELKDTLSDAKTALENTQELISSTQVEIEESLESLYEIRDGEGYGMLLGLLEQDPEQVGVFLSEPVSMETESIFPVDNYGSAMASFYTVLALWVGALILTALLHTHVEVGDELQDTNEMEQFFARYFIFFLVGQAQALLTSLGNLYYIGIQCSDPLLFIVGAMITSFVFTAIMYSLTYAFENVGQAICVVLMVIQVAGAGGTFPVQVLPKIFQDINRFLPFPYAMDALKETVGGRYGNTYFVSLIQLLVFAFVFFLLGQLLSFPARKLNELVDKSKEETGIM